MKVEVKPIDTRKWHGKKGKESFAQPKAIEVLYNHEKGRYDTGLEEEDGITKEVFDRLEKEMGVSLSSAFNPNEPHPYFANKAGWINLPNNTLILDTNRNTDFVKVQNLKASKFVANSMAEYNEGKWPDATHVIFSEEEEMQLKANKFQIIQKCAVELIKASAERKAAIILIVSDIPKVVKGRSQDFIDGLLSELVENKPEEVLKALSMNKDEVMIRATVLELLQKNILTKQNGAIFYMGNQIGFDYEDSLKYFRDPNNAEMKVRLLEKLQ